MLKSIAIPMFCILCVGCVGLEKDRSANRGNNNLNSTLWMQTAAEFKASSLQTYNTATKNLKLAAKTATGSAAIEQAGHYASRPPAVVLDIDETVLDNSRYQAKLVLEAEEFSSQTWDRWVSLRQATAIPGAVGFINYAASTGIEVIYITNRECSVRKGSVAECPQKLDTIENLRQIGISGVKPSHVLLKNERQGWSSEKASRRQFVADRYRIIMLIGDDLGDFLPNVKDTITSERRARLVAEHGERWGSVWFILPNPTYGSWLRVFENPVSQHLNGY